MITDNYAFPSKEPQKMCLCLKVKRNMRKNLGRNYSKKTKSRPVSTMDTNRKKEETRKRFGGWQNIVSGGAQSSTIETL